MLDKSPKIEELFLPGMEPGKESEQIPKIIEQEERDRDDDCPVCGGTGSCIYCESGKARAEAFKREQKQKGFVIPLVIATVALLAIGGGYVYINRNTVTAPKIDITSNIPATTPIVGGDKDVHGCIGSAGYTWCAVKNKCLRVWEEKCELSSNNIIRVNFPTINTVVSSPLTITGEAYGGWYFEGNFPVRIEDANGNILGQHYANAKGEWMTEEYVPFISELVFNYSNIETGVLILSKNNPSDLRKFDDEIRIPIRFDIKSDTELMDLSLYVQDTNYVATSTCSITKKIIHKIPKTTAVADASLKILFAGELSSYARYKSVSVVNGVAKIMLASDMTPAGYPISSLSSCQSSHMSAVLRDTLTQYDSIKSFELSSPKGIIQDYIL